MTNVRDPLSVLILHRMGDPDSAPRFLRRHVGSFAKSFPCARCLLHDVRLPLPSEIRTLPFDAVFLDVTLLGARWRGGNEYAEIRADYAFIREMDAVKIAFPQDEYDCHEILDEWLCDWRVDAVVSVLSAHHSVLYPMFHQRGRIAMGYTAYVDEEMAARPLRPLAERPIDIGYRAKRLPPYFGRLGEVKWTIARDVLEQIKGTELVADIAVGDRSAILGEAWLDFVGSCKFVLGSNSGSSLLDPRGEIQRRVKKHAATNPSASFEEVERECFPGLDGRFSMTAISPRNLEAAVLGTGQILVDGEYSGILRAGEHYLALRSDASNFAEVRGAMRDLPTMQLMAHRCREAILSTKKLTYLERDRMVMDLIHELQRPQAKVSVSTVFDGAFGRYEEAMRAPAKALSRRLALEASIRGVLERAPAPLVSAINILRRVVGR